MRSPKRARGSVCGAAAGTVVGDVAFAEGTSEVPAGCPVAVATLFAGYVTTLGREGEMGSDKTFTEVGVASGTAGDGAGAADRTDSAVTTVG